MKLLKLNKQSNKGFTLIEILLVVGFIAIAAIGVYFVYNKVQVGNQANTEARNIDTLRAGITSMYKATRNYSTVNNLVVNQARITPDNMREAGAATNVITNSFGGNVTIAPATLGNGGGTANGFSIRYENVPGAVCSKLVSGAGSQFNQVTVAGTVVKTFGNNTPLEVEKAAAACDTDHVRILFESL